MPKKQFDAAIWPARSGRHDFVTVASGEFDRIEDAIATLIKDPAVTRALIDEDPRLAEGVYIDDDGDHWMDDWPEKSVIGVFGPGDEDDGSPEYPLIAVWSRESRWSYRCRDAGRETACDHADEDEAIECPRGTTYGEYLTEYLGGSVDEVEYYGLSRKDDPSS